MACALVGGNALAQTASPIVNAAHIEPPAGTVDSNLANNDSSVSTPLVGIVTTKSSNPASGTAVQIGQTITYSVTTTITGGALNTALTLTDTLSSGLTFGSVTSAGSFSCNAASPVVCSLPVGTVAGTYTVTYTATVNNTATTSVSNAVVPSEGTCTTCTTDNPLLGIHTTKASDIGTNTPVAIGQVITYTVTTTISGGGNLATPLTLTDTLSTGLTFGSVTNAGAFSCSGTNPLACTLPAGTAPGTYPVTYTATVNSAATTSVNNTVVPSEGTCTTCDTTNPVVAIATDKTSDVGTGTSVAIGQVITYTLTTRITGNGTLTSPLTLTDTLNSGLTFGAVTSAGSFTCTPGNPMVCSLPTGTAAGTYAVSYTATVNSTATTQVNNTVVPNQGACTVCSTDNPLVAVSTSKSSNVGNGTTVGIGQTITYTLTAHLTGAGALTTPLVLTDSMNSGLTFVAVTSTGSFTCSGTNPLTCTLPAGTPAGTYPVSYTATVNTTATVQVNNTVVPNQGACTDCSTQNPVTAVTYHKAVTLPNGQTSVGIGDTLTYTLTTVVSHAPTAAVVTLTDTPSSGLTFGAITVTGSYSCNGAFPLTCTLPAGTPVGSYSLSYTATVNAQASGTVTNAVVGTGNDKPVCEGTCDTSTPVVTPVVSVSKTSNPASGTQVQRGDTIQYTLSVNVANARTTSDLVLTDTPDPGLTVGALPAGCVRAGANIQCTLPAGAAVGVHPITYSALVNPQAGTSVNNVVLAAGGGPSPPTCTTCSTTNPVASPSIRITKTAGTHDVKIGDLVRYTLLIENTGSVDFVDGSVVDTPAAGFTYVAGSLQATGSSAVTASGSNPIRFAHVSITAGSQIVLVYLTRVGAGVRTGTHINQAQAFNSGGTGVSNIATAQVTLTSDPMTDESLIMGTVFDDRDGDGWQDSAQLTHLHAQGGFAPAAYVPQSTTVDRGKGAQAVPDASAPLLHGLELGELSARQSEADPADRHQLIIRQHLRELAFTDDFTLTSAQGVTVRMDAQGQTRVEKSGDAAKGLNAAAPTVERVVARTGDGYVVDYIVRNEGIDERGIPGVRIASVEGLLIETDQFGRFHLTGIDGGAWERGRNFILKIDPATLPAGAQITTDNPLLRRITPGVPVRFDFGVKLPEGLIAGGTEQLELQLGEVIFAPGSAQIRPQYKPVIAKMAERVREHGGGDVVITANADGQALAFERAEAVRAALMGMLDPSLARHVTVSARGEVDDPHSLVVGLDEGGALLGTVLFDTDKSAIRPEFKPLLDKIAAYVEHLGGGTIAIVGHTDVRGSYTYNTALGMRRAKAVYDAIAQRLSPELRAKVSVQASNDTRAPIESGRQGGARP